MLLHVVLVTGGFALLIKGADWMVYGASGLAKRLGVSDLVVGLTVVAFGTSAPELLVSVLAGLKGSPELCFGNIVGSNTCNVLLIIGASAFMAPVLAAPSTVWKEIPFTVLAGGVVLVQANDALLDGGAAGVISRGDGVILLLFFAVFLVYIFQVILKGRPTGNGDERPPFWPMAGLSAVGLALLIGGGNLVVDSATAIAAALGVSEGFIGLTLVALGTSLPELATSVVAAYRGKSDIAVGNVVGSSIFNVFFVLGVASLVAPLPVPAAMNIDVLVMTAAALMLFIFMFTGKPRHTVQRWEGAVLLTSYVVYLGHLAHRG